IVEKNSSKVFETEEAKTKYFDTLKGKFNSIARKNAHAFLYAMFGLFAMLVFVREGRSEYRAAMYTLFFSMLYAMSDELHQCMITGRGGKFSDVCVDVFGTALMLMIIYAVNRLKKRGKEDNK
ncbi:MAG: VanZ family protein, partial [Firmicutes bacterium]|nr:VanZ family protein [Bacillota bacterium]